MLDHLHDDALVPGAQDGQRLAVFLLHGRQQAVAQGFHLLDDLSGFLHEHLEAHQRQRLVEAVDDGAHIQPGRGRAGKQRWVDGRLKQGQLAEHALDVEAVADLEQAVRHRIPVAEQLVIVRHAEVERFTQAAQRRQPVVVASVVGGKRHQVKGQIWLHIAHHGAELFEVLA